MSRGPLIDEGALAEALIDGHIGGAALDVLEQELAGRRGPNPQRTEHAPFPAPRVVLSGVGEANAYDVHRRYGGLSRWTASAGRAAGRGSRLRDRGVIEIDLGNVRDYLTLQRVDSTPALNANMVELEWGISNVVMRVDLPDRSFVLEQSAAPTAGGGEWEFDRRRTLIERDCMVFSSELVPAGSVPTELFCDEANFVLAMSCAPEGGMLWKQALMNGDVDMQAAERAAELLSSIAQPLRPAISGPRLSSAIRLRSYRVASIPITGRRRRRIRTWPPSFTRKQTACLPPVRRSCTGTLAQRTSSYTTTTSCFWTSRRLTLGTRHSTRRSA